MAVEILQSLKDWSATPASNLPTGATGALTVSWTATITSFGQI